MAITRENVKKFKTSDGRLFMTAPAAAMHQAGVDYTLGLEVVDSEVFKTSDNRTWDDEPFAVAHEASLTYEPVIKRYVAENAPLFTVQGAETRFRTVAAPFLGWLSMLGVAVDPAMPEPAQEPEAEAA